MSLSTSTVHVADIPDQRKRAAEGGYSISPSRPLSQHSVKTLENVMVDRITLHVANLAKATFYTRQHDCFYKRGSHMGLSALVKTLVRDLNIRLGDYGGWESTGVRCAILAVEYLNRISPYLVIHYIQSYFVTAFMLAFKLNDDESLPNTFFAGLGGFSLTDLNSMETEFCEILKWNLGVSLQTYLQLREMLLPV